MPFDCICAEDGFDCDWRNITSGSLSPSSPASMILPFSSSSSCFSLITAADAIGLLEATCGCLLEASFVFVDVVSPRILSWSAVRKISFKSWNAQVLHVMNCTLNVKKKQSEIYVQHTMNSLKLTQKIWYDAYLFLDRNLSNVHILEKCCNVICRYIV